jgi:hypothetical protein
MRYITSPCDVLDFQRISSKMVFRRYIVAVIYAVLIAPLLLPLSLTDAESTTPACCRRGGIHHCAMAAQNDAASEATSGKIIAKQATSCPHCSLLFFSAFPHHFGIPASLVFFAGLDRHSADTSQVEARARVSAVRSHQKRGPPADILS